MVEIHIIGYNYTVNVNMDDLTIVLVTVQLVDTYFSTYRNFVM